jgi:3-(3-hydroxy-phenyl)propionate hydroxylase
VGLTIAQPRVFDTITHRVRMLDDVIGVGWAIVGVDVTDDDWHRVKDLESLARAVRLHVPTADVLPRLGAAPRVIVDIDGGLNREFSDLAGSFVLVRPDRVVAAVWRPAETQVLVTHARTWFAPSDPSSSLQTTNAAPRSAESRNER